MCSFAAGSDLSLRKGVFTILSKKTKSKSISSKILKRNVNKNLFRLTPSLFISPNNFKTNFWCKLWTKINFVHSWLNLCRNPINQSQKFSAKYEQLFLQSTFISFPFFKTMKFMKTCFHINSLFLIFFIWMPNICQARC